MRQMAGRWTATHSPVTSGPVARETMNTARAVDELASGPIARTSGVEKSSERSAGLGRARWGER